MSPPAMPLDALVRGLAGARIVGAPGAVSGIAYDSRLVQPGDLFAALRGANADGHLFIADAVTRGAKGLLVEQPVDSELPQIVVADSRAALAAVAATFYGHPSEELDVIGITGTDGKTTTSFILDHLLLSAGARTGLIGTVAIRVAGQEVLHSSRQTTPESCDIQRYLRQMVDAGMDWAILEATSHGLAMHRLDHLRFRIGAVTNITHEHLDYHKTVENYRRAKGLLLERVAAEAGTVILNADDEGARAVEGQAAGAHIVRFSAQGNPAGIRALEVQATTTGGQFILDVAGVGRAQVALPLIGEFNVANALCAAGIAIAAGVSLNTIVSALALTPPVPGRMSRVDAGQPFSVVVDYAHTPDSLEKVLKLLRGLHPGGRLIALFGSAGERDIAKRPLQGAVSARLADITVVTSEDPRWEDAEAIVSQIAAGAAGAGALPGRSLFTQTDRREAVKLAFSLARPGDCVLLAGKGHEGSIIWGRDKVPWNEAEVARELLLEAGYASAPA